VIDYKPKLPTTGPGRRLIGSILAIAVAITSCSLPVGGEVNALDSEEYSDIVFGVSTTSTTTPPAEEATALRLFYVVGEGGLGDVVRPLATATIPEVLVALQQSPTEDEIADYADEFEGPLRTALPAGLNPSLRSWETASTLATILVDDEGELRTMPDEAPAQAESVFSQIVCTLTGLTFKSGAEITEVEFYDSLGQIPIVDANRTRIPDDRAGPADFRDCETVRQRRDAAAEQSESTTTTEG